ncbi:MAG: 1,4-dihydroxy-6-naphthoate synthase [Desulfobacteraceae bacterium]|nr:1,4-dihydroxy-6-naphthoate synthase [Desulfobacteraceae bacterium]
MKITLGFSPCPNDTFIFNGIANGLVKMPGIQIVETIHDVETLNQMALHQTLDVSKLSFFAWLNVKDSYRLLNSGAALGYGCGPILVASRPLSLSDMQHCRIVFPGRWTTAHLLFRLWAPKAENRLFTTYDRIFEYLRSGKADCGVIIHESRFTFEASGFKALVDLGQWWQTQTKLPIPLGCIAAHTRIKNTYCEQLDKMIRKSITLAKDAPDAALPYIRKYAREMPAKVLKAHIDTFVNEFSLDLGPVGRAAITELENRARNAGIIS